MDFDQAANRAPEQTVEIFGGSLDSIVQEMGILTEAEVQEGRERQALAVALRKAKHDGLIDPMKLPEKNETTDYLELACMDQEGMLEIMRDAQITDDRMDHARARLARDGAVNDMDKPGRIPYIGQIYREKFCSDDELFGALVIQQAVRAVQAAQRIQDGNTNPTIHDQRGEFWPLVQGEPDEVVGAIDIHYKLSQHEKSMEPGLTDRIENEYIHGIDQAFDDATAFFARAGRDDLVNSTRIIKQHAAVSLNGQELLPFGNPDDPDFAHIEEEGVAEMHDADGLEGQHLEG